MANCNIPNLFVDQTGKAEQDELAKQQEQLVKGRLKYIVDALGERKLVSDKNKEYIPDSQSHYYKTLLQAVRNGIDLDEVFLTLPHDIQKLSVAVPDYYTYGVEPYKESGLLIPKDAGKLAVMITGNYGDFKESKHSNGLYSTNLDWQEQVKQYRKLLAAIRKDAPRGITNIGNMTAGHTVDRDIVRPTGANRTNYSSTDGYLAQRHPELEVYRPYGQFPTSSASDDISNFCGNHSWDASKLQYGVRSAGELEIIETE